MTKRKVVGYTKLTKKSSCYTNFS